MVLLSSILFVRKHKVPETDEILIKQKKGFVGDRVQSKKEKGGPTRCRTGDGNFSRISGSKFLIQRFLLLKHKTAKYFHRWKRVFKRGGSFKNPVFKSYNLAREVSEEESQWSGQLSIYDSLATAFQREGDVSSCVRRHDHTGPFDFLQQNNRVSDELYNVSVDWSKDSVFGYESDQEEFYSAVGSGRTSPASEYQPDSDSWKDMCPVKRIPQRGSQSFTDDADGIKMFLESGYNARELLELGCSADDLLSAGCDLKELLEAGCTINNLMESSSCKVHDLLELVDCRRLMKAGYSVRDLVLKHSRIEELMEPKPSMKEELRRRQLAGEELYPACDVSIWLRTCRRELVEPLDGTTTGTIPKWLHGTLLRNGPGSLEVGNDRFQHLFDGSALIQGFEIKGGVVRYRCKFLETNTYKKNQAARRIVVTEFGTAGVPDPCQSIFQRVSVLFNPGDMSDNAMISIYPFGDELYAFSETTVIHRIDPSSLHTMERVNLSKHINIVNHTSHPHVMEDGTVFNVGQSIKYNGPHYCIVKFPPPLYSDNSLHKVTKSSFDQAQIVGSVPARWKFNPSYMHTFGITDNYFIIVEQPLSISFSTLISNHLKNKPMAPCLKWQNNEKTAIHLVSRKTGKPVTKYLSDPFFFLHIINQYEEGDCVILDICCYRDATMLDCMYIKSLQEANKNLNYCEMFRGRPLRFVLPLSTPDSYDNWGTNLVKIPDSKATAYMFLDKTIYVCPELLCDLGCETPRIYYEKHLGKSYRYFYAISSDVDLENPGTLIKVDTLNKSSLTWCEDKVFPSEPVFVPSLHPQSEDDGVVLSTMVWTKGMENKVGLLVLDAKTWKEIGRTVFTTPSPVPKCLHGWFTPYK